MKQPPAEIRLTFCQSCGSTDRFKHMPKERLHYDDGKRCPTLPETVIYVPKEAA